MHWRRICRAIARNDITLYMSPSILLTFVIGYFLVLLVISWLTSRKSSDNDTFFVANRNSKWYLVAFGMIGTALSGVTFISVPGKVGAPSGDQFAYFQFVLGNAAGWIAYFPRYGNKG